MCTSAQLFVIVLVTNMLFFCVTRRYYRAGMASITGRLQAERQLYKEKLKACAAPLQRLVSAHLPAFLNPSSSNPAAAADGAAAAAGGGWQVRSNLSGSFVFVSVY
jgi:hypothetical protein